MRKKPRKNREIRLRTKAAKKEKQNKQSIKIWDLEPWSILRKSEFKLPKITVFSIIRNYVCILYGPNRTNQKEMKFQPIIFVKF